MTILLGDYPIVLLLVLFRVAGLLFMMPIFGVMRGSGWLLAGASFPTALLFCTLLPDGYREAAAFIRTPGDVVVALIGEVLMGAAFGAICATFIGAFTTAGNIAEKGTSLSTAEELDPMTGEPAGMLSQIYRLLFIVLIFATDAHLVLIRLVLQSFETLPVPWMGWMNCGYDLAQLGGVALHAGLSLALPALVATTLVTIAMALLARFAPAFNVLFLSMPFRIVSGIWVMGLSILLGEGVFRSMARDMLSMIARFLAS